MQSIAKELTSELEERGLNLLVQGGDIQRHKLLEEFKRDVHSVLFGLDSFWMGVDVPGEALEHVIITRLPFAVPNHPLIEARLELIEQRGGNAFMEFSLPESILKFRQGVGRLLRSRTDKGMVTILDSRVLTKRYGRMFVASLPRCPIEVIAADGETEYLSTENS
jgi:ATP-dependent DNA helicase DinG